MLEKEIEGPCVTLAKSLGWLNYKMDRSRATRWRVDQVFFGPAGQHLFVEFKRPGETLRPHQATYIEQLRDRGHVALVIDNVLDFKIALEGLENGWSNRRLVGHC